MTRRSEKARRAYRRRRKNYLKELDRLRREGQTDSPTARLLQAKVRPLLLPAAEPATPQDCAARVRALTATMAATCTHLKKGVGQDRRALKRLEAARNERGALLEHLETASPHVWRALYAELNLGT